MPEEFEPRGKTFSQRLDAFLADAKSTYSVEVRQGSGRTAQWQQKHHVAHMFAYNKYLNNKPANVEPNGKTIAWSHFSDPSVIWNTIRWEDFLKTKSNGLPIKEPNRWKPGFEPDRTATETHVKQMLRTAGIGSRGEAMVSAGISPCGEPCRCKAGRSRHLENLAADLNSGDLDSLAAALQRNGGPSLDDYLKSFGLHRPLKDHADSAEKWHVEALSDSQL